MQTHFVLVYTPIRQFCGASLKHCLVGWNLKTSGRDEPLQIGAGRVIGPGGVSMHSGRDDARYFGALVRQALWFVVSLSP